MLRAAEWSEGRNFGMPRYMLTFSCSLDVVDTGRSSHSSHVTLICLSGILKKQSIRVEEYMGIVEVDQGKVAQLESVERVEV
jgi:hypothetical protein